jgi:hypothetical protein
MHTRFWSENLKGIDLLGELRVDRMIILKTDLNEIECRVWTRFISLSVGSNGGFL